MMNREQRERYVFFTCIALICVAAVLGGAT